MRGIKILLQDFALKMQGGLMREGGRIAGHYGTNTRIVSVPIKTVQTVNEWKAWYNQVL